MAVDAVHGDAASGEARPVVTFRADGPVATITIERPEARNAVNGAVAAGIEAAMDRLEEDDSLWVGILTGAGPVFSAGADLKVIAGGEGATLRTARGGFAGLVQRAREKPLVAAVDGPALAGGCELVLACDLVVASRTASFGLPEVKRSLVAAAGGLFRLPKALPRAVAMEALLTGDPLPATRAYELGMVNLLTEPGEALAGATQLAARIVAAAPLAVRATRRVALAALQDEEGPLFELSQRTIAELAATADFAEGPRAFIEKRLPRWQGR
jgi:enoyl-CoA hydratase